jgi:hypothetical protein
MPEGLEHQHKNNRKLHLAKKFVKASEQICWLPGRFTLKAKYLNSGFGKKFTLRLKIAWDDPN